MKTAKHNSSAGFGRTSVFLLVIVAVVGAYYYASPYLTLHRAGEAIEDGDAQYLCDHIDFETLRENLADDAPQIDSPMIRQVLDSGISCETVESAMSMIQFFDDEDTEITAAIREDASYGFESPTTFSMRLGDPQQRQIRLILSRTLLDWQLTDITVNTAE